MFITYWESPGFSDAAWERMNGFQCGTNADFSAVPHLKTVFKPYRQVRQLDPKFHRYVKTELAYFKENAKDLFDLPEEERFHTYYIPKKDGGRRRIDEPIPRLMQMLSELRVFFEDTLKMLPHNAAYAYRKNVCTLDALKVHQAQKNKWFMKTDFHNFFGSTTLDNVMLGLEKLYPTGILFALDKELKWEMRDVLSLAFLKGTLPQGTPISPLLTNLVMVPVDYKLSKQLEKMGVAYTRYADDMQFSSKEKINVREVESILYKAVSQERLSYKINEKKTRVGSVCGKNWNLGLMLNRDQQITVGHRQKDKMRASLCNLILDEQNNKPWSAEEKLKLSGRLQYYKFIEPAYFKKLADKLNKKFHVNIDRVLKPARFEIKF